MSVSLLNGTCSSLSGDSPAVVRKDVLTGRGIVEEVDDLLVVQFDTLDNMILYDGRANEEGASCLASFNAYAHSFHGFTKEDVDNHSVYLRNFQKFKEHWEAKWSPVVLLNKSTDIDAKHNLQSKGKRPKNSTVVKHVERKGPLAPKTTPSQFKMNPVHYLAHSGSLSGSPAKPVSCALSNFQYQQTSPIKSQQTQTFSKYLCKRAKKSQLLTPRASSPASLWDELEYTDSQNHVYSDSLVGGLLLTPDSSSASHCTEPDVASNAKDLPSDLPTSSQISQSSSAIPCIVKCRDPENCLSPSTCRAKCNKFNLFFKFIVKSGKPLTNSAVKYLESGNSSTIDALSAFVAASAVKTKSNRPTIVLAPAKRDPVGSLGQSHNSPTLPCKVATTPHFCQKPVVVQSITSGSVRVSPERSDRFANCAQAITSGSVRVNPERSDRFANSAQAITSGSVRVSPERSDRFANRAQAITSGSVRVSSEKPDRFANSAWGLVKLSSASKRSRKRNKKPTQRRSKGRQTSERANSSATNGQQVMCSISSMMSDLRLSDTTKSPLSNDKLGSTVQTRLPEISPLNSASSCSSLLNNHSTPKISVRDIKTLLKQDTKPSPIEPSKVSAHTKKLETTPSLQPITPKSHTLELERSSSQVLHNLPTDNRPSKVLKTFVPTSREMPKFAALCQTAPELGYVRVERFPDGQLLMVDTSVSTFPHKFANVEELSRFLNERLGRSLMFYKSAIWPLDWILVTGGVLRVKNISPTKPVHWSLRKTYKRPIEEAKGLTVEWTINDDRVSVKKSSGLVKKPISSHVNQAPLNKMPRVILKPRKTVKSKLKPTAAIRRNNPENVIIIPKLSISCLQTSQPNVTIYKPNRPQKSLASSPR